MMILRMYLSILVSLPFATQATIARRVGIHLEMLAVEDVVVGIYLGLPFESDTHYYCCSDLHEI